MELNVENLTEAAELFQEKMGFQHDAEGLEMSDEQLVNFLLLCQQVEYGIGMEDETEESDVKVKVMKIDGGSVHEMMDELLGHGSPMPMKDY